MTKLIQPFIFLATFYSAMANADEYNLSVTFATGPDQPTRIVSVGQYCMNEVPGVTNLVGGKATIGVDTNAELFSKCGWVHSSATFVAQDSKKEKKLEFEFYKDVDKSPYLEILWPPHSNCSISGESITCGHL